MTPGGFDLDVGNIFPQRENLLYVFIIIWKVKHWIKTVNNFLDVSLN